MKAQRRHELQQNELARMLMESREFFNKYGAYVAGGLLVVVVILVGGAIWRNSWQNRQLKSWNDFAELRREANRVLTAAAPADPMELVNRFRSLSATDQLSLRLEALQEAGSFAWQFAVGFDRARDAAEKAALLDTAVEIYDQITRDYAKNTSAVGRAQLALATIREEQGRFDDAKKIYDALIADPRFADSYVRARAEDGLERLPRIAQPIVFAPPPPPPPPAEAPVSAPAAPPAAESESPASLPADAPAPPSDETPAEAPGDASDQPQPGPEPADPETPTDPAPDDEDAPQDGPSAESAGTPVESDEADTTGAEPQPTDSADAR